MKSRDFVYWIQGYFEISGVTHIGEKEMAIIKNHLNMVFKHEIDPSNGSPEHNKELNKIHQSSRPPALPVSGGLTMGGIGVAGQGAGFEGSVLNC